eukprot:TRINITY_DN1667_c0_g3_i1.p1 TRINITY_DN1667_c0_g3~~TRINITY_DN1667_c0_g3_i1.p1  ORF type:complete len:246 (+),score=62.13 TRINITY_DN1667_c0_g3_i1:141-878(+)
MNTTATSSKFQKDKEYISFTVRVVECKKELKFFDISIHTILRQLEFDICERLGMDPMTTDFAIRKYKGLEDMQQCCSLQQNEVNFGDLLVAKIVQTTSKGRLAKVKVNEYVDDHEVYYYYPDYKYVPYGLVLDGICNNPKCICYQKEVIIPLGSGSFDFKTIMKKSKCPCCPYKDRELDPPIEVTNIRFGNCFWRYDGEYKDQNKFKQKEVGKGWYRIEGEDNGTFYKILKSRKWIDLNIHVKQI